MTQTVCFLCNSRFFVGEDDYVCSKPVCSYCMPYTQVCCACSKIMKSKRKAKTDYGVCDTCKGYGGFPNKYLMLRYRTLLRDSFTCRYCGRSPMQDITTKLHVDHIKPRAKGGEDFLDNLVTSCAECNMGKIDILLIDYQTALIKKRVTVENPFDPPETSPTDAPE